MYYAESRTHVLYDAQLAAIHVARLSTQPTRKLNQSRRIAAYAAQPQGSRWMILVTVIQLANLSASGNSVAWAGVALGNACIHPVQVVTQVRCWPPGSLY